MKKMLSLFLALCLLTGLMGSAVPYASAEGPAVSTREMDFYVGDPDTVMQIPVSFIGDSDVPCMAMEDWAELMTAIFGDDADDEEDGEAQAESDAQSYSLTASFENHTGTLTREDGFWASFDCEKDQIVFLDYDAFVRRNEGRLLIDVLSIDDPRSKDDVSLFRRSEGSYERYGDMLTLDLAAYGIDLVDDGKTCYVPVQTLSDFMLAVNYLNVYYNGEDFFLVPYQGLGNADDGYTPLGEKFYSVQPKQWSQAMADYNYAELCLAMDHLYGLKDIHHIESFDALQYQVGLRDAMKSTDPASQDEALYSLINLHLDDLHSGFNNLQAMNDPEALMDLSDRIGQGYADRAFEGQYLRYLLTRLIEMPDDPPGYEEIGNTAYITFDDFIGIHGDVDYYETAPDADAEDTIGLMIYAYSQVTRENSPIKNVVIDLTCNTGGEADAAVFVISAFLGDGSVSAFDPMTGAMTTAVYNVDINLDHEFDEKDLGFTHLNLYCLTSPVSFSCGNLVPCVFKNSNEITLLGRTSGGGSCVVLPMSTACGTGFQMSGFTRLAFTKNGSFYDIDQGATPDFPMTKLASFYDREALTDYINTLK